MHNNKAIAIPFFVLLLTAVLGLGGLVIDLSQGYSTRTKIKNAVDFAVLAGVSQLITNTDITNAKNTALNFLNANLSGSISSFEQLSLDNINLSIQVGVYDFSTMTFTQNESAVNPNAIMVFYSYNYPTVLSNIFMISTIQVSDQATAAKQIAGKMAPGGGFPLAVEKSVLAGAKINNNMIDLTQAGATNSYFTAFMDNTANASDITGIIDHFINKQEGITSPGLTVGELLQINNGTLTSIYMSLDPVFFEGMTFVSPIVSLPDGFSNKVKVEGFIGLTINDLYKIGNDYHIAATVIPGYIDNNWSGLTISAGPGNISQEDQSLLATSFALVF